MTLHEGPVRGSFQSCLRCYSGGKITSRTDKAVKLPPAVSCSWKQSLEFDLHICVLSFSLKVCVPEPSLQSEPEIRTFLRMDFTLTHSCIMCFYGSTFHCAVNGTSSEFHCSPHPTLAAPSPIIVRNCLYI